MISLSYMTYLQSSLDIRDATGLGTLILIYRVILVINSCDESHISMTYGESVVELSH